MLKPKDIKLKTQCFVLFVKRTPILGLNIFEFRHDKNIWKEDLNRTIFKFVENIYFKWILVSVFFKNDLKNSVLFVLFYAQGTLET